MSKKIIEAVHNEEVELIPIYKVVSKNIREEARFKELNRIKLDGMRNDSGRKEKISKTIRELFGISDRYARAYQKVINNGCVELQEACIKGDIPIMEASKLSGLEHQEQVKELTKIIKY